jgi:hypothetical protein
MTGEPGLIGLLYGADWTRLSLSAEVSDRSAVLVVPGKRYWYRTADSRLAAMASAPGSCPRATMTPMTMTMTMTTR